MKQIPLAKPTGTPLSEHISNLLKQASLLFGQRPFVLDKYKKFTQENLSQSVNQSAIWHDEGKKDDEWQHRCQKDYEYFLRTGKVNGINLRQVKIRHELASLQLAEMRGAKLSLPVKIAVASHHSKLSRREKYKKRWSDRPEFEVFWKEFANLSADVSRTKFSEIIKQRFRFSGVRSWLQLVDHRASAFEQNERLPDFNTFSYEFPYTEKRGVQEIIEQLWDEPFAILRSPTGSGKTDAALLWAEHQCQKNRADRVIFAMPTRFTANALSISNAKAISEVGLYHSSALFHKLQANQDEERKFIDKEQELARKLEMPCVVTTIDHLCLCLTGTREDHHSIFFGLANSCVVIDEADFYDEFTQANIIVLLKVLRILKVPVLLMSATVPESAARYYEKSGFKNLKIFEDKTDYEKPRCVIKKHGQAEIPDDIYELLERTLNGEPTIIYANTVKRGQDYFRWFQKKIVEKDSFLNPDDVVLYHSRYIESHKLEKETSLVELLGKDAWKNGDARGVAILTQIGEMSVNISADLMISDLCPIDRLAQRAGRLSRFKERFDEKENVIGELFIVEPFNLNKKTGVSELYPAPYGEYQNGWIASDYLTRSNELLTEKEYSAKTFVDLVNTLYPVISDDSVSTRENQKKLSDMIFQNWLILPAEEVKEDDEQTLKWRCRDIPPQVTVYVEESKSNFMDEDSISFKNKTELRQWENSHSLNIYPYEFDKAVKDANVSERHYIFGYDESEKISKYIVKSTCYSKELGLDWSGVNDDD
jgi:CRISPR-associated endonuclease/helicase Cas3